MPDGQPPVYDPNTRRAPLTPVTPHAGTYGVPSGSGAGGPGFRYDEATLRELMNDWNELANDFKDDQRAARIIAATEGPGLEYASGSNADQVRKSGKVLTETLYDREQYCRNMARRFQTALGKYVAVETTHSTEIKRTGGSL